MGTREKYMGRRYVALHPWSQWGMSGVYKGGPSIRYQDWDDPYMNQANPEQKPVVTYALDGIRELTIPDADWSVGAKSGSLQASAIRDNVDAGNAGMSQIDTENFSDGYQGQHGSCWTNPGHIYCKKGNIGNERHQIPENPMPAYINMNRPPGY